MGPPKYAWSPRMPSISQLPESRMIPDSNRMYPMHPQFFGSGHQYPLSDYLPPHHSSVGHDVIGGVPPPHVLGTSHSSPQLAQVKQFKLLRDLFQWSWMQCLSPTVRKYEWSLVNGLTGIVQFMFKMAHTKMLWEEPYRNLIMIWVSQDFLKW